MRHFSHWWLTTSERVLQVLKPFLTVVAVRCASAWSWIQTTSSVTAITSKSESSTSRFCLQRNWSRSRGGCERFHYHMPHIHTLHIYIWPIRWRVTVPLAQAFCACEILTRVDLAEMNEEENFTQRMIYDYVREVFVCFISTGKRNCISCWVPTPFLWPLPTFRTRHANPILTWMHVQSSVKSEFLSAKLTEGMRTELR